MCNVHTFLFDRLDELGDDFIIANLAKMPLSRQKKCANYHRIIDKKQCIAAYLLLCKGMSEIYNVTDTDSIEFLYNENGKPYLKNHPFIKFNMSHCGKNVVCVLSEFEIGIDIQEIFPLDIRIAETVCTKEELNEIEYSSNCDRSFCQIWTRKESFVKFKGISIRDILKTNIDSYYGCGFKTYEFGNSIMSLCFSDSQKINSFYLKTMKF